MAEEFSSIDIENEIRNHSSNPEVALKYAYSLFKKYKPKPTKPKLPENPSEENVLKFAKDFSTFEKESASFKNKNKEAKYYNDLLEDAISDYICEESGVAEFVPRQYIKKLYEVAEENVGSSKEDYRLFLELKKLVRIFQS